ncbi:hypothetical protein [Ensifer adhaerens]|uniref:hypothetical protein n=1 Tax=Ensifer adhaerens TaxID=106592 RepID=UPI003F825B6B
MSHDWKAALTRACYSRDIRDPPALQGDLLAACGPALRVREARQRLFLVASAVLCGAPKLIEIEESLLLMISLDDLSDVLKATDLNTLLRDVGKLGRRPRRRVSNR